MRSFLFVPADSERKLAKGPSSGPDGLILDLEDSVAADRKPVARDMALAYLKSASRSGPKLYVRVNALDTGLTLGDLAVVMQGKPDGIVSSCRASPTASCFQSASARPTSTFWRTTSTHWKHAKALPLERPGS
jgi:citrate lyase beta subunit